MAEEKRKKKKKLESLIRFYSANKIDNYNRGGKKEKKNPKESTSWATREAQRIYRTRRNIRIINVFLESLLSQSFPSGSHIPPHLPRMSSNTVLISGPAVGAA